MVPLLLAVSRGRRTAPCVGTADTVYSRMRGGAAQILPSWRSTMYKPRCLAPFLALPALALFGYLSAGAHATPLPAGAIAGPGPRAALPAGTPSAWEVI